MALPNKLDKTILQGGSSPDTIDDALNSTITALEDILGIPDDTNISNKIASLSADGLTNIFFQDGSADPAASGELVMSGSRLLFHDSSAVQTLAQLTDLSAGSAASFTTMTISSLTVTAIVGPASITNASFASITTASIATLGVSSITPVTIAGAASISAASFGSITTLNGGTASFTSGSITTLGVASLTPTVIAGAASITGSFASFTTASITTLTGTTASFASITVSGAAVDRFPASTVMLFQQTAAPTGWTKITTHNDKVLRLVSGTVSSGGGDAFTTTFGSGKSTDGHALTIAQMPSHDHTGSYASGSPGSTDSMRHWNGQGAAPIVTKGVVAQGGGGTHSHGLSNMDLQYVDIILAAKD